MIDKSVFITLRRFHRWLALLLFVFLAFIGLTGAILQGITLGWGEFKPHGGGLPSYIAPYRYYFYMLHTGGILGYKGNFYSIICGVGLLYFSVSGLLMYYNLYVSRRDLGRNGLFWQSSRGNDKQWRSMHRWLAVVMSAFMLLYALTSISLNIDYIRFGVFAGSLPVPGQPPGGPGGQWHEFVDFIHKLDFLGNFGHFIGIFVGLSLSFFSISGIMMYFRLFAGRSKRRLFW